MLNETSREREFRLLREMKIRNESFWRGVEEGQKLPIIEYSYPDIAAIKRQSLAEQASKGGRATKADCLTVAIRRIVDDRPDISEAQLRRALIKVSDIDLLDASDRETTDPRKAVYVRFLNRHGLDAEIPLSGLKDRLSRAKSSRAKRLARVS